MNNNQIKINKINNEYNKKNVIKIYKNKINGKKK